MALMWIVKPVLYVERSEKQENENESFFEIRYRSFFTLGCVYVFYSVLKSYITFSMQYSLTADCRYSRIRMLSKTKKMFQD